MSQFILKFLWLVLMLICVAVGVQIKNYKQEDFIGKTERIDISTSNAEYIIVHKSVSYKHNRTDVAFNLTIEILKDLGTDIEMKVQVYKFASNEYRRFPISFPVNLCRMLKEDIFGSRALLVCGNFSDCPYNKGLYVICEFVLDYSKFPPHIPIGRYMIDLSVMYDNLVILNPKIYVTLKDAKWES